MLSFSRIWWWPFTKQHLQIYVVKHSSSIQKGSGYYEHPNKPECACNIEQILRFLRGEGTYCNKRSNNELWGVNMWAELRSLANLWNNADIALINTIVTSDRFNKTQTQTQDVSWQSLEQFHYFVGVLMVRSLYWTP